MKFRFIRIENNLLSFFTLVDSGEEVCELCDITVETQKDINDWMREAHSGNVFDGEGFVIVAFKD